jgi:hypothetical protein
VGRITPSYRTIDHRQIARLRRRKGFYRSLREKQHQEAFNNLLRVWGRESAVLSNANIPSMMDIRNLMANVHAKRQLEDLKQQAEALRQRLRTLEHGQRS